MTEKRNADRELLISSPELTPEYLNGPDLLDQLPVGVYVCDLEGRITRFNQQAAVLWGRKPSLLQEHFSGALRHYNNEGEPIKLTELPAAKFLRLEKVFLEEELVIERPDQGQVRVQVKITGLKNKEGKMVGILCCMQEIRLQPDSEILNYKTINSLTKKLSIKEAALDQVEKKYRDLASSFEKIIEAKTNDLKIKNDELKKSEERYHKMVEEVEDYAIILLDENGFIRNWNKGAEKIKGYKEHEILGKSFQVFYQPQDRASGLPLRLIKQARDTGKAIHEGWRLRADGTKFWGSIVLTALHGQDNEIIGFSKVTRDLTERKIAEDKLRDYTNQLKFQNEQLEQFAYAASHDMKEPLRKIMFYNNHLAETSSDLLPPKEREYLNRSINAARRMERLINDLLEYSKASSETHKAEAVDLHEILDEIIMLYKDVTDEKKAVIRQESLPVVQGIAFQLRQVFDNIISNSLKYQHPDRNPVIEVKGEIVSGEQVPGLLPDQQYHRISFADNGIGFEDEYAEKIFELFQRLSHSQYSGTGVGLALCKKIAQNHHGTITAKAKENEGACFELYLPA